MKIFALPRKCCKLCFDSFIIEKKNNSIERTIQAQSTPRLFFSSDLHNQMRLTVPTDCIVVV
jgi:hypothetical protein